MFWRNPLLPSSALRLQIEAAGSHEMLVLIYLTAWHHITDDRKLHNHQCENLKFHTDTDSLHK